MAWNRLRAHLSAIESDGKRADGTQNYGFAHNCSATQDATMARASLSGFFPRNTVMRIARIRAVYCVFGAILDSLAGGAQRIGRIGSRREAAKKR